MTCRLLTIVPIWSDPLKVAAAAPDLVDGIEAALAATGLPFPG